VKRNQSQAGAKNSRASKPSQARKTTGKTLPPAREEKPPTPSREDRVSRVRMDAFEGRTGGGFDPDIPGLLTCEWCDGALVDRVCAALYDAEPMLGDVARMGDMPGALSITHRVMERVRERGLRPQEECEPENWSGALPGMQARRLDSERATLCFLSDAIYQERHQLVRDVIPKLSLDRALALADALVIAETDCFREGMSIDEPERDGFLTPLQQCSEYLRRTRLVALTAGMEGMSEDLPSTVCAWAKGGAN
jgi:hypothetical protein